MEHGAARSSPSVRTTQRETSKRVWRNWQTRMVEGHVGATPWRFESSHPHFTPSSAGPLATLKLESVAWRGYHGGTRHHPF